jgi:type VI secretion system protein ImpK
VSDNPFLEPEDNDRTVIRPSPSGRRRAPAPSPGALETVMQPATPAGPRPSEPRAPAQASAAAAVPQPESARDAAPEPPLVGLPPLAAAAAPLLTLLARLRNTARQPDPASLRERAAGQMRDFERRAREAGVSTDQLRPAHYALCAAIDDAVLATPWGAASEWRARSLTASFHPEPRGQEGRAGERFFDVLTRLRQDPGKFLPVIELMYACLSLGYMGRARRMPQGAAEIERLRADTAAFIAAQRPAVSQDLSPRWHGVAAPFRRTRAALPVWVVVAIALALCGGLFAWASASLNAASDGQFARMLQAPPAQMPRIERSTQVAPPPPPPAPTEPSAFDRLRAALQPEIEKRLLTLAGTATTPMVRIGEKYLFAPTSATLLPSAGPLLARVAAALAALPGAVQVIGYSDNQPVRTVQFPSAFQLSAARAQAVRAALAQGLQGRGVEGRGPEVRRIAAEGRADSDPLQSNATADGREQNRRMEILLHSQE